MPERNFSSNSYRYGFNGKEKDDEVNGSGNSYDYGFRIYNPRLGRFLSRDPLTASYPFYTPYQFAGNKPIVAIDLDGLEEFLVMNYLNKHGKIIRTEIVTITKDNLLQNMHLVNKTANPNEDLSKYKVAVINYFSDGKSEVTHKDKLDKDEQKILKRKGATTSIKSDVEKGTVNNYKFRNDEVEMKENFENITIEKDEGSFFYVAIYKPKFEKQFTYSKWFDKLDVNDPEVHARADQLILRYEAYQKKGEDAYINLQGYSGDMYKRIVQILVDHGVPKEKIKTDLEKEGGTGAQVYTKKDVQVGERKVLKDK